jgi:hypothetical protein
MAYIDIRFHFDEVEENEDPEDVYKYLDFTGAQRISVSCASDFEQSIEYLGEQIAQSDKWQEYLCGFLSVAFESDEFVPFTNSGW